MTDLFKMDLRVTRDLAPVGKADDPGDEASALLAICGSLQESGKDEQLVAECHSATDWKPSPGAVEVSAEELRQGLSELGQTFLR